VTDDVTRPFDARPAGPPPPAGTPPPDGPLAPAAGEAVPDLRAGLGRLSRGLIAYGIIALIVAGVGLALLLYANTRIDTAGDRVEASVGQLTTTLDRTAQALHDASATAATFNTTLDQTQTAVAAAANTIVSVRTNLQNLESVLRSVSILGASPLGGAANAVGGVASSIEGLDSKLTAIAGGLTTSRDSLAANAGSLGALGDSIATTADRLRSGVVEDSLADVHVAIVLMLFVLTAWAAVPAIGAIVLGVWLRRRLEAAGGQAPAAAAPRR
jgi:ABC-type transporter Mla subunit MlaD